MLGGKGGAGNVGRPLKIGGPVVRKPLHDPLIGSHVASHPSSQPIEETGVRSGAHGDGPVLATDMSAEAIRQNDEVVGSCRQRPIRQADDGVDRPKDLWAKPDCDSLAEQKHHAAIPFDEFLLGRGTFEDHSRSEGQFSDSLAMARS